MTIKVWHCHNARSLRVLWALEEMGMDYEVEVMPFPQTVYIRYTRQEPPERGLTEAATDYMKWYHARLRRLNRYLEDGRKYLVGNRFTIADIGIAYALHLGEVLKIDDRYKPLVRDYLDRMRARPTFQKVIKIGEQFSPF